MMIVEMGHVEMMTGHAGTTIAAEETVLGGGLLRGEGPLPVLDGLQVGHADTARKGEKVRETELTEMLRLIGTLTGKNLLDYRDLRPDL